MTKRSRIHSRGANKRALALAASFVTLAISIGGCLLTSSFDNVAGVRPPDAAPPPDEAGTDEAGPEAGEAGPPPQFSCATEVPAHFLCSDFDEGNLLMGGWSTAILGGGTATLDTTQFRSGPGAFLGKLPEVFDTSRANGGLFENFKNLVPKAVHMAFDMRVASCSSMFGGNGSITLASVAPSKTVTFGLIVQPNNNFAFGDQVIVDGGPNFKPTPLVIMPVRGVWTRVKMDITLKAAGGSAVVTLDDKVALTANVSGVTPDGNPFLVNIGPFGTGPIVGCTVDYDNVTLDPDL